jgi:hypothetical protein
MLPTHPFSALDQSTRDDDCHARRCAAYVGTGILCVLVAVLAGCGGGSSATAASGSGAGATGYTLGGTISGLPSSGLTLTADGQSVSPAAQATSFTFPNAVTSGTPYSVTVASQPAGVLCAVSNGSGTVSGGNVTSVQVTCTTAFTVGGAISGLTAAGLVLANGGATVTPAAQATQFTFPTALPSGSSYSVTVQTSPTGLTCTVGNASGTIAASNVTNVDVACAAAGGAVQISGAAAQYTLPSSLSGANWAAIDGAGNVYLQGSGSVIVELQPHVAAPNCSTGCITGTVPGSAQTRSLSIDAANNLWVTTSANVLYRVGAGQLSNGFSPIYSNTQGVLEALVANDGSLLVAGNTFISSTGTLDYSAVLSDVSTAGAVLSSYTIPAGATGGSSVMIGGEGALAQDGTSVVYASIQGDTLVKFTSAVNATVFNLSRYGTLILGPLAIDSKGGLWTVISSPTVSSGPLGVLNVSATAASDCSSGCRLYAFPAAAGVTFYPSQIAVDGSDNILLSANVSSNGTVSIDSGSHYTGAAVVLISPTAATDCSTGCSLVASALMNIPNADPSSLAVDQGGNVWDGIYDNADNLSVLVELPHAAAPTPQPIVTQSR